LAEILVCLPSAQFILRLKQAFCQIGAEVGDKALRQVEVVAVRGEGLSCGGDRPEMMSNQGV
jgi:hypothetical protein